MQRVRGGPWHWCDPLGGGSSRACVLPWGGQAAFGHFSRCSKSHGVNSRLIRKSTSLFLDLLYFPVLTSNNYTPMLYIAVNFKSEAWRRGEAAGLHWAGCCGAGRGALLPLSQLSP